ncbi:nuclear transport factor 2 family protein [Archangium primigenium]|uniref:nuclear transport factor 2 family protein n=1 Tax=[Archangium] primigenium TaxID=2792470 RepID=UPI00195C01DA|nr:nuclear transport factor 2 family protein [Archangium primigenium]MBM7112710.1 nuclear transport factor 2 family protein [Archangium primigenium]
MTALPLLCLLALGAAPEKTKAPSTPLAAVNAVLDDWHRAAAEAHEARYFGHFTPDAVYLGTDGTERWTRDAFRVWARPYFQAGQAWNFTPSARRVTFAPGGAVAWFDEALATTNMGPARGSGVLVKQGGGWKIAQYNLSVPIPNALLPDFKARIEAHGQPPAKP